MTSQQAWIFPGFKENNPIVTIRICNNSLTVLAAGKFKLLLDGKTILAEQKYEGIGCCSSRDFIIPLPNGTLNAEIPHKVMLNLKPEHLSARQIERDLICIRIPYSTELSVADFESATPIRLNREDLLVRKTVLRKYGWSGMNAFCISGLKSLIRSLRHQLNLNFSSWEILCNSDSFHLNAVMLTVFHSIISSRPAADNQTAKNSVNSIMCRTELFWDIVHCHVKSPVNVIVYDRSQTPILCWNSIFRGT